VFISLEGPDGSGKSTQSQRLVGRLEAEGFTVVPVHEPGGTELADEVRAILLKQAGPPIDPWAEALLFSACRAQLVTEVIKPALTENAIVVADRFADSTLAYQGAGRGLEHIDLQTLIRLATSGIAPDLTVLLDIPVLAALDRLRKVGKVKAVAPPRRRSGPRGSIRLPKGPSTRRAPATQVALDQVSFFEDFGMREGWNRFEAEDIAFHDRVRDAFLALARNEPERWTTVDARVSPDDVEQAIWEAIEPKLPRRRASRTRQKA
jgi:dTMP kinase